MSASALSVADTPAAGGAGPAGRRLLGLVQRMMGTGMAMARCINRIARQRLEGQDLRRMAPAGFNATATNALIVVAVAWTAALRERVLAVVRPSFAPGLPRAKRAPQGRGAADYLPEGEVEPTEDDWHDWRELAKPWRMGPGGVAVAARMIAGMSDREVVSAICDKLSKAAAQLGAEADIPRIAALEAAARALCPDADSVADEDAAPGCGAAGAAPVLAARPLACALVDGAEDDPPPRPPD